jgi:hypothetical protein
MDNNNFINKEDKNNKKDLMSEENKKEYKLTDFVSGFLIFQLSYLGIFIYYKLYDGYGMITALLLAILYITIGIIIWAVIRFGIKKRFLAFGFLIGGFSPLLVIFIITGGCGLFIRS